MLIGVEKRFIFVANTKSASTSIEHLLMPYSEVIHGGNARRKHSALRKVLGEYRFLFAQPEFAPETFFRFGVMREPIDWMGSWFRYRKGKGRKVQLPREMSFAEYWAETVSKAGDPRKTRRPNQHDIFVDRSGAPIVDVIIPHHRLDAYLGEICELLGIPFELAEKNVSALKAPKTQFIPEELLPEMRAFFERDYALWDQLETLNAEGMEKLRRRVLTP